MILIAVASFFNAYILNYDVGHGIFGLVSWIILAGTVHLIVRKK